jgi:hypothetical protein
MPKKVKRKKGRNCYGVQDDKGHLDYLFLTHKEAKRNCYPGESIVKFLECLTD